MSRFPSSTFEIGWECDSFGFESHNECLRTTKQGIEYSKSILGCTSYIPEIKQLDQTDYNAGPKSNHRIFALMWEIVEVSPLFHSLRDNNQWTANISRAENWRPLIPLRDNKDNDAITAFFWEACRETVSMPFVIQKQIHIEVTIKSQLSLPKKLWERSITATVLWVSRAFNSGVTDISCNSHSDPMTSSSTWHTRNEWNKIETNLDMYNSNR